MSDLRYPLKDYLRDPVDEAALYRIAEKVDASAKVGRRRRPWPLVLVATAAAAVAIVAIAFHGRRDAGPLLFADGLEPAAVQAGKAASDLAFSDGSHVRLSPGARFEPLQSTGTRFSAIVAQGRADFDVKPGGPRHWVIECGLATVEVLGTSFTCDRAPGRLRVAVNHGVVLVRGERVPDRARRLLSGESLELSDTALGMGQGAEPADAQPETSPQLPAVEPQVQQRGRIEGRAKGRSVGTRVWRDLAGRGRHQDAYAALGSDGLRRESGRLGVADLLALADVARLSGHPAEAVMPLERILGEFSSDAQAPLAAFALGRLELDSLGHAQAAVAAFRKALALGISSSLREDVRARLVEAYVRGGDRDAAQRAADAYAREFPSGRHARAIQGWLHVR